MALQLSDILHSDYYRAAVDYLTSIQRKCKDKRNRNNPSHILTIQHELLHNETKLWDLIKKGRSQIKILKIKAELSALENKKILSLQKHVFIHEQLIRISRTIADGIAWRSLNYNRTFLSSSSRGYAAGDPNVGGKSKPELDWACRIFSKFNSILLINDLTRFLRVGDLTEIRPDKKIILHEVKGRKLINIYSIKKKGLNKKLTQQEERLLELQKIAVTNSAEIDGKITRTMQLQTSLKTHVGKVHNLIKKSKNEIYSSQLIESFLTIDITNFRAVSQAKNFNFDELKTKLVLQESDKLILHSNWDSFFWDIQGNFLRTMLPYSIFPLSSKDCTHLMSGHYLLKTYLNINSLKSSFIEAGYEIEETSEKNLDVNLSWFENNREKMFTKVKSLYQEISPDIGFFTIRRGHFSLKITPELTSKLTTEFFTFDCFLNMIEEMYNIASQRQRPDQYFPRFSNEDSYWN